MENKFEPTTEQKVWGTVQHIFGNEHAGVSCLVVKLGYRCSIHYHEHRGNLFTVLEGRIVVELFDSGGMIVDSAVLGPGNTLAVPALVTHRFRVLQSGRVVEVYWADRGPVRQDDIVRQDEGGEDDWKPVPAWRS